VNTRARLGRVFSTLGDFSCYPTFLGYSAVGVFAEKIIRAQKFERRDSTHSYPDNFSVKIRCPQLNAMGHSHTVFSLQGILIETA